MMNVRQKSKRRTHNLTKEFIQSLQFDESDFEDEQKVNIDTDLSSHSFSSQKYTSEELEKMTMPTSNRFAEASKIKSLNDSED
jgi:hypothetical protein